MEYAGCCNTIKPADQRRIRKKAKDKLKIKDLYGENSNDILLAIPGWSNVHPLLKVIPAEWEHSISFGLLRHFGQD